MKPLCSLTVPSDTANAPLVRSCLRDVVNFSDEDASSSFLIAVTEVFVNAVEASLRHAPAPPVIVEFWDAPERLVKIVDRAGGIEPGSAAGTLGLGLSLVDEHVRMHAGRVWVEDRLDGESGARFVIELMAAELDE